MHSNTQKILVADDDQKIRSLLSQSLEQQGFLVTSVSDGIQAWEALQADVFDLLITDDDMPGLSGKELLRRIEGDRLVLPVIIASGSTTGTCVNHNAQGQISASLPKPFRMQELLDLMQNLMKAARQTSIPSCG